MSDSKIIVTDKAEIKQLTPREKEVLTLIAEGYTSKEVAARLYVSKRTVDFHLANTYQKLNVKNRVQALRHISIV